MASEYDLPDATIHDDGAEQAVLGVLLAHPEAIVDIRRTIAMEDFYKPMNQIIFKIALQLDNERQPIEPRAILSVLNSTGEIKRIPNGAAYLSDIFGQAPPAASVGYYVRLVKEASTRRSLNIIGIQLQQRSLTDGEASISQILEQARGTLDNLAIERLGSEVPMIAAVLPITLDGLEKLSKSGVIMGVPTGFVDLDKSLNGLQAGQMIVIAARPGVGKLSLAMDIARHAAFRQDKSVIVFSLEMSAPELVMRMLSAEAYVDSQALRTGDVNDEIWQKLAKATNLMSGSKLAIDDTATVTISEIRAKARAIQRLHGLDLIVIDYLQLMNADNRSGSRQEDVSDMSRGVKLLAKEFKIPVVVLSQLNRGPEQRQDKRPVISDLRESGSIEQDADVVILLHREEMYEKESPRAGEADIIIAKQRSGPTGTIALAWQAKYTKFANLEI